MRPLRHQADDGGEHLGFLRHLRQHCIHLYVVKDGQYLRTDAYTTDAIKNSDNKTEATLYIAGLVNMVENYNLIPASNACPIRASFPTMDLQHRRSP